VTGREFCRGGCQEAGAVVLASMTWNSGTCRTTLIDLMTNGEGRAMILDVASSAAHPV
jgi:hypothetical protein